MNNRFLIRPDDPANGWPVAANCKAAIWRHAQELHPLGKAVEVRIGEAKSKRSLAQNSCLHGWATAISDWWDDASGQRIEPLAWKEWFKREYLGEKAHQMPDGRITVTTRSTTDLTVAEFKDFLTRIEAWASEQDGLELPRGEDYAEAML